MAAPTRMTHPVEAFNWVWDDTANGGLGDWVVMTQPGGSGGGAVTIADGADVAQGTTSDVAWVSGSGTVISLLKKIASSGTGGGPATIADGADVAQGTTSDAAWVSGSGTVISLLKKIASAGGGAVSIADGADVAEGATTDTKVVGDVAGTVSAKLRGINTALAGTLAVSAASLPLPANAAKETGGNLDALVAKDFATQTTLALVKAKTDNLDVALSTRLADSTFTTRINTQGQKTMAASTPVVLASDQAAIPVSGSTATVSGTLTNPGDTVVINTVGMATVNVTVTAGTGYGFLQGLIGAAWVPIPLWDVTTQVTPVYYYSGLVGNAGLVDNARASIAGFDQVRVVYFTGPAFTVTINASAAPYTDAPKVALLIRDNQTVSSAWPLPVSSTTGIPVVTDGINSPASFPLSARFATVGGLYDSPQPTYASPGTGVYCSFSTRGALRVVSGVEGFLTQLTDGTNGPVAVKPASTLPVATDAAVVVTQRDAIPAGANVIGHVIVDSAPGASVSAAATASSPVYTEGVSAPLSQDLAGNLRIKDSVLYQVLDLLKLQVALLQCIQLQQAEAFNISTHNIREFLDTPTSLN